MGITDFFFFFFLHVLGLSACQEPLFQASGGAPGGPNVFSMVGTCRVWAPSRHPPSTGLTNEKGNFVSRDSSQTTRLLFSASSLPLIVHHYNCIVRCNRVVFNHVVKWGDLLKGEVLDGENLLLPWP